MGKCNWHLPCHKSCPQMRPNARILPRYYFNFFQAFAYRKNMMKKTVLLIPIMTLLILSLSACGSSVERTLESGNQAFSEQAYEQALETYAHAMEMAPTMAEPVYNLANTLYRMEAFEQTGQLMGQALELASEELAQHGFYNLGNNFYQQQQMDGAVEAYKESLRLNPDDLDAKYNLELALQQQEQQSQEQQQEEEQQEQQDGDQQQDQNQSNQDQQEQDQSSQDQQEPQGQNPEGQEQQDDQGESGEDQQEQNQQNQAQNDQASPEEQEQHAQGQPQQLEGLTEEQARQILGAIGQSTETLQEKLQEIFGVPVAPFGKDW
jgi:Ca-activated chloride channel family protein